MNWINYKEEFITRPFTAADSYGLTCWMFALSQTESNRNVQNQNAILRSICQQTERSLYTGVLARYCGLYHWSRNRTHALLQKKTKSKWEQITLVRHVMNRWLIECVFVDLVENVLTRSTYAS